MNSAFTLHLALTLPPVVSVTVLPRVVTARFTPNGSSKLRKMQR
jgi:hypothetical protein